MDVNTSVDINEIDRFRAVIERSETSFQSAKRVSNECFKLASSVFSVPENIIRVIAKAEGGVPGSIHTNNDNSVDIGVMQINSIHWSKFESLGITIQQLQWNGCASVIAGTYLLRQHYDNAKSHNELNNWDDLLKVTARYHSTTPSKNMAYQVKLKKAVQEVQDNAKK